MAKQINVSVGGVVKKVKEVPLGVGGVVKKAKKGVCGVGGVVKTFFQNQMVIFSDGAFQNGFAFKADSENWGKNTAFISGDKIYIPYDSSADGLICITWPSGLDATDYSKICFDLYFGYMAYCGRYEHDDDTDYAGYLMNVRIHQNYMRHVFDGGIDLLDDNYNERVTIEAQFNSIVDESSNYKTPNSITVSPRCMRNDTYAATPSAYIYKIWLE